jgi:hypothetical protein
MAGMDLTALDYALKTLYPDGVQKEVFEDNPFLTAVKKNTKFVGRNKVVDVIYGDTQGRSASIAKAQANYGSHAGIAFTITRAKDYAYAVFDREAMMAADGNEGSTVEGMATEMQSAINVIRNSLAHAVWGNGGGSIGQIAAAGITGAVITLADPTQAVNFEINKVLQLSTDDGTGGAGVRAGTVKVLSVDRDLGKITCTGNVTAGIAAAAAADYIFTDGDYGAKLKGVNAWIPGAAPSSGDNFWGVDRSKDTQRLAGLRFDGSSYNPEEALIQAAGRLGVYEGKPDFCWLNYLDFTNLETSLGSKKVYEDFVDEKTGIGFRGLVVKGPRGDIKAVQDRNCPKGVAYLTTMSTWTLYSLGEAPMIVEDDGLKVRRIQGTDSYGAEIAYYAQLACNAPGKNARIVMPT